MADVIRIRQVTEMMRRSSSTSTSPCFSYSTLPPGASNIVNGTPDSHFASNAACIA